MWGTYAASVTSFGMLGIGLAVAFWILLVIGILQGARRSYTSYSTYLIGAWLVNCFLFMLPAITLRVEVAGGAPDAAIVARALLAVSRFLCVHLFGTAIATLIVILAKPRRHARLAPMLLLFLALAGWFSAHYVSRTAVHWHEDTTEHGETDVEAATGRVERVAH